MNNRIKVNIFAFITVLFWGSGFPFTRIIGSDISSYSLCFLRMSGFRSRTHHNRQVLPHTKTLLQKRYTMVFPIRHSRIFCILRIFQSGAFDSYISHRQHYNRRLSCIDCYRSSQVLRRKNKSDRLDIHSLCLCGSCSTAALERHSFHKHRYPLDVSLCSGIRRI